MSNKFKISELNNLISADLSDNIVIEHQDFAYGINLSSLTENVEFSILKTQSLQINGADLKAYSYKGNAISVSNDGKTIEDENGSLINARNHAGWIYTNISDDNNDYASNGKIWNNIGPRVTKASESQYGIVKIGNGLKVENGVISTSELGDEYVKKSDIYKYFDSEDWTFTLTSGTEVTKTVILKKDSSSRETGLTLKFNNNTISVELPFNFAQDSVAVKITED